ncbi:MAG: cyclase family protein [Aggregatilineales bacterium]
MYDVCVLITILTCIIESKYTLNRHIIDLTLPFEDGKLGVEIEPQKRFEDVNYNTSLLHFNSHALTHMDAPLHFLKDGYDIADMPLERCIGEALVIDVTHKAPNSFITVDDLGVQADDIGAGSRVLLRTDWSLRADEPDYREAYPRISLALAQWFAEKQIYLIGIEMPSVASMHPDNRQELIDVHQTLLNAEIVIIEGLANLHALTQPTVEFVALPLKITGSDGSPVRAIAIEP